MTNSDLIKDIRKVDLSSSTLYFLEGNIVVIYLKDNKEVDLKAAKEQYRAIGEVLTNEGCSILTVPGIGTTITKEVRDFIQRFPSNTIAEAIVVDNLAHRIVANFISKFNRPGKQVKLFSDEKKAIKWLRNFNH